jgi:hypothetical protein
LVGDRVTADPHAYQTPAEPGVRILTPRTVAEVVGANGRRLLVADMTEGVYVGSVLVTSAADLLEFAELLRVFAEGRK